MLYHLSYSRDFKRYAVVALALPVVKPVVKPVIKPVIKPVVVPVVKWWAVQGLNLRPLPCEESALPPELTAPVHPQMSSRYSPSSSTRLPMAINSCDILCKSAVDANSRPSNHSLIIS